MSSLRYTSVGIMRPPKPPCWRDFILSSPKSISSDVVDVPDSSGRAVGARSPVTDFIENSRVAVSLPGNKPSRLARRPRARIHRTRSEHVIQAEDLPESTFTATLADTDPKGLRAHVPEGRLYVEDNNKRCQNWLAGVQAAEPLDEVDYTADKQSSSSQDKETKHIECDRLNKTTNDESSEHHATLLIYDLQQRVDVEIPEESFVWDASKDARGQSIGSDEDMSSACKETTFLEECEKTSELPVCSHAASPTHSPGSPKSTPVSPKHCQESSTSGHISPVHSPVSTTNNPVSPARSPASSIHSPISPTQTSVSPTCSQVSPFRNPVTFTHSPVSPLRNPRELEDHTLKFRHRNEHVKCENSSNGCSPKPGKCDKKTGDRKRHKLCCDYDHTDSSSGTDDSFRCQVTFGECGKNQMTNTGIQERNSSPNESGFSLNHVQSRSSSQRSTTSKLLSDSELWALNLSTCD